MENFQEETRTPGEYLKEERQTIPWDPVQWLKTKHTRELLGLRNACIQHGEEYHPFDDKGSIITRSQVLAELARREHIPNKNEAKMLRKLMSQNRLTEDQVRKTSKFATMLAEAAQK